MCDTDIAARRARDLERYHRRTAERRTKGLCLKCGKRPPAPHRSQCDACAEKQRAGDLARYHRRTAERIAKGLCPKCGKRPPERSQCGPCLEKDAAAGRARDARLRAAGMPRRDPEKARIAERRRRERQTDERRAAGLCPECGETPPAPGRTSLRTAPGSGARTSAGTPASAFGSVLRTTACGSRRTARPAQSPRRLHPAGRTPVHSQCFPRPRRARSHALRRFRLTPDAPLVHPCHRCERVRWGYRQG